jgi:hypothetical protein
MSVIDVIVERRRVTVFFDHRGPSSFADQRRIERAIDNSRALAPAEAAGGTPETHPFAA